MRPPRHCLPFLAGALLLASPAAAQWPCMNCIFPGHVTLVSCGPTGPDSVAGHCTAVIRDLAANPIAGVTVTLDFSSVGDMAIALDQQDPRLAVNCATRTVSTLTDANGVASFTVLGRGLPAAASLRGSLRIYADGILLGSPGVAVLDLDGVDGLTLADFALWTADFFSATSPQRSDLDGNGSVDLADLSRWSAAYFSGNDARSAGPSCP